MKSKLLKGMLLLTVAMFNHEGLFAQMYVSPSTYVYVNNEQVYITSDLELNAATSNLYLRNEGQLLQGTTGAGANKGVGDLSAYQEGTSNNYGYNYWCSPVGVPAAGAGNNAFGIGQLKRPATVTTTGGESIVTTMDGSSTNATLAISNRWIFKYITSNLYANWVYVGSANTINAGEGFTMKGVSGSDNTTVLTVQNNPGNNQRYDFRGKPNDGTINIAVGNTAGPSYPNQTLTGNPYPSAINLNSFLLDNSGWNINYGTGAVTAGGPTNVINGNAYFWEHQKPATSHMLTQYVGGYGVYTPNGANIGTPGTYVAGTWNTYNGNGTPNTTGGSTGSTYTRQFSPVGQGFMIRGNVVSGNAQMKNIYRVFKKEGAGNNSQFDKNGNSGSTEFGNEYWDAIPNVAGTDYTTISKLPVPQFKIHTVFNNEFTRETALAFNDMATDGMDNAIDGLSPDVNLPIDTYFPLAEGKEHVVSTLPFNINKRMPIAFRSKDGATFKVTVNELINFNLAKNIYIYDKQTGIYNDIKNDFFEITLPAGIVSDRFEITFKDFKLDSNEAELSDMLTVYQNNDANSLTIANPNMVNLNSCSVYDVAGKLIFSKKDLGANAEYAFPTSNLSDGVYIVRVNSNNNKEMGIKVIVKH